jgi:hypothetical protein
MLDAGTASALSHFDPARFVIFETKQFPDTELVISILRAADLEQFGPEVVSRIGNIDLVKRLPVQC